MVPYVHQINNDEKIPKESPLFIFFFRSYQILNFTLLNFYILAKYTLEPRPAPSLLLFKGRKGCRRGESSPRLHHCSSLSYLLFFSTMLQRQAKKLVKKGVDTHRSMIWQFEGKKLLYVKSVCLWIPVC